VCVYIYIERETDGNTYHYDVPALSAGGGDGMLLVNDAASGQLLYGLGANRAAVRAAHATPNRLVCAGDDGHVLVYTFDAADYAPRAAAAGAAPVGASVAPVGALGAADSGAVDSGALATVTQWGEGTPVVGLASSRERTPSHGRRAGVGPRPGSGAGAAPPARDSSSGGVSAAQQFADKKRLAMDKAARIRAERQAAERRAQGAGDMGGGGVGGGGMGMGGGVGGGLGSNSLGGGGGGGGPPMSELDMLHALGDKKYGRGGHR